MLLVRFCRMSRADEAATKPQAHTIMSIFRFAEAIDLIYTLFHRKDRS